jgi:hypothetical protein
MEASAARVGASWLLALPACGTLPPPPMLGQRLLPKPLYPPPPAGRTPCLPRLNTNVRGSGFFAVSVPSATWVRFFFCGARAVVRRVPLRHGRRGQRRRRRLPPGAVAAVRWLERGRARPSPSRALILTRRVFAMPLLLVWGCGASALLGLGLKGGFVGMCYL